MTSKDPRLGRLLFVTMSLAFCWGQRFHDGGWSVIGSALMFGVIIIVIIDLLDEENKRRLNRRLTECKVRLSLLRTKPSNSGMGATVAAVARATGTHVTVRDPQKPSPSSDEPHSVLTERQRLGLPIIDRK